MSSKKLEDMGIYLEKSFNGQWCYKHQPVGKPIIIVSDSDKEVAATKMIQLLTKLKDI